jgi:murein L,D-transpeptidase YcbB/YkuD
MKHNGHLEGAEVEVATTLAAQRPTTSSAGPAHPAAAMAAAFGTLEGFMTRLRPVYSMWKPQPGPTWRSLTCLAVFLATATAPTPGRAQSDPPSVTDSIRGVIAARDLPGANRSDDDEFRPALSRLYTGAANHPLWWVGGRPTTQARQVIEALASADRIGLVSHEYDGAALQSRAAALSSARQRSIGDEARFDVWLSLALMRYLRHAHAGRIDPQALRFALPGTRKEFALDQIVLSLSTADDIPQRVAAVEPTYSRYVLLKAALTKYQRLAADTSLRPPPNSASSLHPGDRYSGIPELTRLLVAVGDLPMTAVADSRRVIYDGDLVAAVTRFQARHGLDPDGILGASTFEELRQPLSRRVQQIELALERWRWMPDDTSHRFVLVNIPEFRVRVFTRDSSGDHPVLAMDAIVGEARRHRYTPVFTATMEHVVFRPYWDVPPRIARLEEIPKIRRQPEYFVAQEMEIVRGHEERVERFPPTPANLSRVEAGVFRLRQRPGNRNALGLVKFVFPNAYTTYLHGTPAQSLFSHSRRDFSHGCMRLSDPPALAEAILEPQGWNRPRIDSTMHGDRTIRVNLAQPIPVHVLYLTAMPGDSGGISFFRDIYHHDAALVRALRERTGRSRRETTPSASSFMTVAETECTQRLPFPE